MGDGRKISGVVFSDLGQGASFMSLDWVQQALREKMGFSPYAGTLNLRVESEQDISLWKNLRKTMKGVDIPPSDASFCHARCFLARIDGPGDMQVAVVVPEVDSYPLDKIEIVAPFHLKDALNVHDGDRLTLEFVGE